MTPIALDGIADRAKEHVVAHLAFDQIVLRPGLHGFDRALFVVVGRQHDDRHVARVGAHGEKGFQAVAVGQGEVQKNHIKAVLVATFDRRRKQFHLNHVEWLVPAVAKEIAHHPNVVGIVFNQ